MSDTSRNCSARNEPKTLVMTGGTSGFGRRLVERLLDEHSDWRVFLLARRSARADELAASPAVEAGRLVVVDVDLASLTSVTEAVLDIQMMLEGRQIDAMALNAGIQAITGDQASADGLELSFAVNHLAHFLMMERLAPHVRTGGRIVVTSSEVHDPEVFCLMGITRAAWQHPRLLADSVRAQEQYSERVDRGEARYCASKLLNLMTVRHYARAEPRFSTVAFNPSVVPGTDIARERNFLQVLGWKYVMPALAPILPGARSVDRSAGDLLWLVTEADAAALNGAYVDGRSAGPGSAESRDEAKIAAVIATSREILTEKLAELRDRQSIEADAELRRAAPRSDRAF